MLSSSFFQGATDTAVPGWMTLGGSENFGENSEKFYLRGIKTSRHLIFASTKALYLRGPSKSRSHDAAKS